MNSFRRWTGWPVFILAAAAVWIWVSAAPDGSVTGGRIPAPQRGFLAPDFKALTSTGESISLSDLRGQPVLINLWTSWCGPCREEMPAMQRLYEEYASQGFVILAVNAANQDSRANAQAFIDELGLTFTIIYDETGEISRLYNLQALPTSYFIYPDGVISEVVIGGPMAEALLRVRVELLLTGGR